MNQAHDSSHFLSEFKWSGLSSILYKVHRTTLLVEAMLIGSAPEWAHSDGGSAGLHPSNLQDYRCASKAINLCKTAPIVLWKTVHSLAFFVLSQ